MLIVALAFACYLALFGYVLGGAWLDARRSRIGEGPSALEAYELRRREDRLQHFAAVRAQELAELRRAERSQGRRHAHA